MRPLSFTKKIWLSFWVLLLATLAIPFIYHSLSLSREILAETHSTAVQQLDLAEWLLEEHGVFQDTKDLDDWLTDLGNKMDLRLTVIENGKVIADSEVPFQNLAGLDDHSFRPEILEARERKLGVSTRFSRTLDRDLVYAAQRLENSGVLPDAILRVAIPLSNIADRKQKMLSTLLWAVPVTLIFGLLASYLLTRSLARSLRSFIRTAERIGRGNYSSRIRVAPGYEFQPLAESINSMAASIESHLTELSDKKGQLEALFASLPDGVMVLGERGRIEVYNRAMEAMFGSLERYAGKTVLDATMALEAQRAAEAALKGTNDPKELSASFQTPSGLFIDVRAEGFHDQHGSSKVVLVFQDVTRLRNLERMRKDFVANLSHELRTPLTSIKGFAETLQDNEDFPQGQRRQMLEIIAKNANHMTKILKGLVTLSELDSSRSAAELAPVDAVTAVNRAMAAAEPKAEAKDIQLASELPEKQVLVQADSDMLEAVVDNLLDNAIRYSPKGSLVTVRLSAESPPTLSVEDQGPGIPLSEQEKIFERFYRTSSAQYSDPGGPGLGLAIAKHMVERLRGSIKVDSPVDKDAAGEKAGARFTVVLQDVEDGPETMQG